VLIDGERRWKCAQKLSLPTVPIIVEPKPTRLENILRMFDIHNVRSQWDLLAISLKLQQIRELLSEENKPNSPKDISVLTGLSLAAVRRAFDLLTLPGKYLKLLRVELEKPKSVQEFSEDLFIEMRKALRVVARYTPEVTARFAPERLIDVFFGKYERKIIRNVVAFRKVSPIARSENVGVPKDVVIPALRRLVEDPNYTIEQAYAESVEAFKDVDEEGAASLPHSGQGTRLRLGPLQRLRRHQRLPATALYLGESDESLAGGFVFFHFAVAHADHAVGARLDGLLDSGAGTS